MRRIEDETIEADEDSSILDPRSSRPHLFVSHCTLVVSRHYYSKWANTPRLYRL